MPRDAAGLAALAAFMDDPEWWKAVGEEDVSRAKRALPSAADCSPVDVEAVAAAFAPSGPMRGTFPRYEPRPGQIDMARAVARALNGASHLMIEAGTGVGKSLAYLVPALHWACLNDTPVIVSTATRNLQSQLLSQDIPRAIATLPHDARPRVAALKGRRNYACLRMAGEFFSDGPFAMSEDERREAAAVAAWLKSTPDGDLDALAASPDVSQGTVASLSCPGEECAGRRCRFRTRCFVMKARANASKAHLVVTNHALVLAEAAAGQGASILPAYGRVVFDEAHNLPDIATDFFTFRFSRAILSRLLSRLVRAKGRGARRREAGILHDVRRLAARGAIAGTGAEAAVEAALADARAAIVPAMSACDSIEDALQTLLNVPSAAGARQLRFRIADGTERHRIDRPDMVRRQYNLNGLFADYPPGTVDEAAIAAASLEIEDALAKLLDALSALAKALEAAGPQAAEHVSKTAGMAESLRVFTVELKFILSASDPDYVYWASRTEGPAAPRRRGAKPQAAVTLSAAPVSAAAKLHALFCASKDTVAFCSATLRTGSSFAYMARNLGFDLADPARAKSLVAASPFDYASQAAVYNLTSLDNPAEASAAYARGLAAAVARLAAATGGRMLVLFTSYEMMSAAAEAAATPLAEAGTDLLVQGSGPSRELMAETLRRAKRPTVLFGAQSFWEGVDIPGDALSCVVMARLPFPQAMEPVVAARCERIEENGGSAFRDYMLPEAVLKFRQGFGRLVRSRTDCGVVVVADPRLTCKNYGRAFAKSLPVPVRPVGSVEELASAAGAFLARAAARASSVNSADSIASQSFPRNAAENDGTRDPSR